MLTSLIDSETNSSRYSHLTARDTAILLSANGFISDQKTSDKIVADLFWDSHPTISEAYRDLLAFREKFSEILAKSTSPVLRCDYSVARLLLDMGAIHPDRKKETEKKIELLGWEDTKDGIILGQGRPNKFLSSLRDFALFQALILELVFPLRAEVLAKTKQGRILSELLEVADLLDFPGVSNIGEKEDRLKLDDLTKDKSLKVFPEIIKRGKTASIVASTAKLGQLDGMTVMLRIMTPLARPAQITSTIKVWWKERTGKELATSDSQLLPLNWVLTFFGALINDVVTNSKNPGIGQAVQALEDLKSCASPKVSNFHALRYPAYESDLGKSDLQGNRQSLTENDLRQAMESISGAEAFARLFANDRTALEMGFKADGSDYLIKAITEQARSRDSRKIAAERLNEAQRRVISLFKAVSPEADSILDQRISDLEAWRSGISKLLKHQVDGDIARSLSFSIRQLIAVQYSSLTPIPQQAVNRRVNLVAYVEQQLNNWRSSRLGFATKTNVGLSDDAILQRNLGYLTDSVDVNAIVLWIRENAGHLTNPREASDMRRHLAIKFANALLWGNARPAHSPTNSEDTSVVSCFTWLDWYARKDDGLTHENDEAHPKYAVSPHYRTIIFPFLGHLEALEKLAASQRKSQPGDVELLELKNKYPSILLT